MLRRGMFPICVHAGVGPDSAGGECHTHRQAHAVMRMVVQCEQDVTDDSDPYNDDDHEQLPDKSILLCM